MDILEALFSTKQEIKEDPDEGEEVVDEVSGK